MMRPPAQVHHPSMPVSHSHISPLTPGSPVHPDGLIPPMWVRKHREIQPSVVIGFYDLWNHTSPDPIQEKEETVSVQEPLGTTEPIEKEKDYNLALEINERRFVYMSITFFSCILNFD
jgi:trafficking protein particle complex subunit 11